MQDDHWFVSAQTLWEAYQIEYVFSDHAWIFRRNRQSKRCDKKRRKHEKIKKTFQVHEYPGGVPSRKEAKEDHYCVRTCFSPPNWSQVRNPEPLVPRSLGRQGVKFPAPLTRYFFTFIFYPPPLPPHTRKLLMHCLFYFLYFIVPRAFTTKFNLP